MLPGPIGPGWMCLSRLGVAVALWNTWRSRASRPCAIRARSCAEPVAVGGSNRQSC